jgi:hypothetical protein
MIAPRTLVLAAAVGARAGVRQGRAWKRANR